MEEYKNKMKQSKTLGDFEGYDLKEVKGKMKIIKKQDNRGDFCLSDRMMISFPNYYCEKDVKEFVRRLKEDLQNMLNGIEVDEETGELLIERIHLFNLLNRRIDKMAGEKLTK